MSFPIFDAHFHIGSYGTQRVFDRDVTPVDPGMEHPDGAACRAYLKRNGAIGGVMIPCYLEDQSVAFATNDLVLDAVDPDNYLYGALWVSPIGECRDWTHRALAHLPHAGVRALKIASNTWTGTSIDPRDWSSAERDTVEAILAAASAHNLVIHFHTGYLEGADPLKFDAFMSEYGSAATYQLVHMGEAILPAFKFMPRFVEWLDAGYDVYTDTSMVPGFAPAWLVRLLLDRGEGIDRVMFATDGPWGGFPVEVAKVESLDVDDTIKQQIFSENALRLYAGTESGP